MNKRVKFTSRKTLYGIKYYGHSSKRGGVIMKIMFVLLAGAVIMFCAVILGLHLKNKVETAPEGPADDNISLTENESSMAKLKASADIGSVNQTSEKISHKTINGDFLDISKMAEMSKGEIKNAVTDIAFAGYSAVTVNLTDTNGDLLYSSEAASSVARIKSDASSEKTLPDIDVLKSIVSAAENAEVSVSAIITNDFSGLRSSSGEDSVSYEAALFFDCAIIRELESIGFDEIILRGYTFSSADKDQIAFDISAVNDYIKALKATAPDILIGIALPPSVYRNIKYTPAIEVLSQRADILAIDIYSEIRSEADPDAVFDTVADICSAIPGSFTLYNIRAILSGDSAQVRTAQLDALLVNSISNWQFISGSSQSQGQE